MLYAAILLAALYLNKENDLLILFALLTALTRYLPMEMITNHDLWYFICFMSELLIISLCLFRTTVVTYPLVFITGLLELSHVLNYLFPILNAYYVVANYLEYMQIICFILVSPPIINYLKRKLKLCLQKCGCGC